MSLCLLIEPRNYQESDFAEKPLMFIHGTFRASPHLHGSPIYCSLCLTFVTKIKYISRSAKTPIWSNAACSCLPSGVFVMDFPLYHWFILICLSPLPWFTPLSASLFPELLRPLYLYLYIYSSLYPPDSSSYSPTLASTFLCLSFFPPLSWCYPPVSPDAAKLIRTHPIISGRAYVGASWGVCVGVCVCQLSERCC